MSFLPRLLFGPPREIVILEGTRRLEERVYILQAALDEFVAAAGWRWHVSHTWTAAVAGLMLMVGMTAGFVLGVYREPIGGFAIGLAQNVGLAGNVPVDPEIAAERRNYTTALRLVRPRAESGDPRAQFTLGRLYYDGNGNNTQDYDRAVKWFRRAADQGNASAQLYLGLMSDEGQGVPQDYAEAAKWYRRAAEQECAPAQCNLGLCYETGRGVPKDVREAVKWFCRAARAGDKTAQHNLGVYYATLEAAEQAAAAGEAPPAARSDAEG